MNDKLIIYCDSNISISDYKIHTTEDGFLTADNYVFIFCSSIQDKNEPLKFEGLISEMIKNIKLYIECYKHLYKRKCGIISVIFINNSDKRMRVIKEGYIRIIKTASLESLHRGLRLYYFDKVEFNEKSIAACINLSNDVCGKNILITGHSL